MQEPDPDGAWMQNSTFCKGAQGCVTSCPHLMYSNTANISPFSDDPFIVASACPRVECVSFFNNLTPRFKKRRLHGELVQEKGDIVFKWANIHKTCVHDRGKFASKPISIVTALHVVPN